MSDKYAGVDVPALWASLKPEGTEEAWKLAAQWRNTSEMLHTQWSTLLAARTELADAWPPEKNASSNAFISYIDEVLDSMSDAASRASTNHDQLMGTVASIELARNQMKPLYDQWTKKVKDSDSGEDADWQKALNQKALTVMSTQDRLVEEHTTKMVELPEFDPVGTWVHDDGNHTGDDQTSGMRSAAGAGTGTSIGHAYNISFVQPPEIAPPSVPPTLTSIDGPMLTSGPSPTTTLPPTSPTQTLPGRVIGPVAPTIGLPVTSGPNTTNFRTSVGPSGRPVMTGPLKSGSPVTRTGVPGMRPAGQRLMPPGGVIGQQPPAGGFPAGTARGGATGRQMAPKGSVIGGSRSQSGSTTGTPGARGGRPSTGSTVGGRGGAVGGRRGRQRDDDRRPGFDPNDPWHVAEGVPSVLEPDQNQPHHDAGPGVIGLDR